MMTNDGLAVATPHSINHTHARPHNIRAGSSPISTQSRSTTVPLSQFDSYTFKNPSRPVLRSHSPYTSSSSSAEDDDDLEDEEDEDESSASSDYNEEDHRRLLFAMAMSRNRGGMNPQLELAMRLMEEAKEVEGSTDEDEDDEKADFEEDDLDSVEDDLERGYTAFPITSRPSPTKTTPRSSGEWDRSAVVSPAPAPPTATANPYAAYGPEPGLGRIKRWLDGVRVSEMVA